MTVLSSKACGMFGTATEWLFQFDHATPYCDNVSVACTTYRLPRRAGCSHSHPALFRSLFRSGNTATLLRLSPTARITEYFRDWQAGSIDSSKGGP